MAADLYYDYNMTRPLYVRPGRGAGGFFRTLGYWYWLLINGYLQPFRGMWATGCHAHTHTGLM